MVIEIRDDAKEDGEEERDRPEEDCVGRLEEELERREVVFEAFLLEPPGYFESSFDEEDAHATDAA